MESIENKVAFGMVFSFEGELSQKIHGRPLPVDCLRVSVDGCIKPEALLPVPVPDEMVTVEEALGSHVAWPKDLIIFTTPQLVCIYRTIIIYFWVSCPCMLCSNIFMAFNYN